MAEQIATYLKTVQEQIRWKRARPVLALELERHLNDQKEAFQAEGKDEATAVRLALEDMGDPVELGAELDRVHRPRPQWGLLGLTVFMACGCAFLRLFLTAGWIGRWDSEPLRTLLALALGTICLLGAYFLDLSRLARHAGGIYLAILAFMLGYILFDVQLGVHWPLHIPNGIAYYLFLFAPIPCALWTYWCRDKGWRGLVLAWAGVFPIAILGAGLAIHLANGIALICTGSMLVLYAAWKEWFGVGRWQGFGAALAADISLAAFGICWFWQHSSRLQIALHPELDPENRGYFGLQIRALLQDIPLVRSFSENGRAVFSTVHALHDGTIFAVDETLGRNLFPAIIAARWGWLAFLALLAITAAFILWLLVRSLQQTHRLGRLIVLSAALSLGFRAIMSILLNLGFVLFITGYPFLGGNMFMIMDMALTGLALSVFRGDSIAREEYAPPPRRIRKIRLIVEYR